MAIITLLTDFGLKDQHVGALKGSILSELPNVRIVDVSHLVEPFNVMEAAFLIRNSYKSFPEGSIHIVGVDAERRQGVEHIAACIDGHYFICADNGVLSLLAGEVRPEKVVEINIHNHVVRSSFPERDTFVKVACHIARGGRLEVIGRALEAVKPFRHFTPEVLNEGNQLLGRVIYIDNYGSAITNITRDKFREVSRGRNYIVTLPRGYRFSAIVDYYHQLANSENGFSGSPMDEKKEGQSMALFNAFGYMEVAIHRSNPLTTGGAASLLGLKPLNTISIDFL